MSTKIPSPHDISLENLKNSLTIMLCLMNETEDVIKALRNEFSNSSIEYHVREFDDGRIDDEFYSHKHFASYCEKEIMEMYTTTLPSMMRRSVFLTIYGLLEFNIIKFCEDQINLISFPIKLNELNGKGVMRCVLFLQKILGVADSNNFNLLKQMVNLRNICIHNNGVIDNSNRNKISRLIEFSNNPLSITADTIIFNEDSVKFLICIIDTFFNEIQAALYNLKDSK